MTDNPYASPDSASETVSEPAWTGGELPIASQGRRLVNLIVDSIIIQVLSGIAGLVVGVIYVGWQWAASGDIAIENEAGLEMAGYAVGFVVALAYFFFMETVFQRTLAKFLTGTVVVDAQGARPSLGQIAGRSAARFIPFEAFSFLVGKHPVGWHDSLSGTRVIRTP